MSSSTLRSFVTDSLIKGIFGDKPFQIQLVRSQTAPGSEQDPPRWRWDVKLPLGNPAMERQFLALITPCVQVDNDQEPASVTIMANQTNVGYEAVFTFDNAFFRKRGKRRLQKAFAKANDFWVAAVNEMSMIWEIGIIQTQLDAQVMTYCMTEPALIDGLRIRFLAVQYCQDCHDYHPAKDEWHSFISTSTIKPGTLVLFELNPVLSNSGFAESVIERLTQILKDLGKQAMSEFMTLLQQSLVKDIPVQLQEHLQAFVHRRDQMVTMGIPVKTDPLIDMLITTLETFVMRGEVNTAVNKVNTPAAVC